MSGLGKALTPKTALPLRISRYKNSSLSFKIIIGTFDRDVAKDVFSPQRWQECYFLLAVFFSWKRCQPIHDSSVLEEYVWIQLFAAKLDYVLSFFLLLMIGIAKSLETTSKAIREVDIFHILSLLFVPERYMIMYVTKGRAQMSARYVAPHIKQVQISPFKERLFSPSISWILPPVLLSLSAQPLCGSVSSTER